MKSDKLLDAIGLISDEYIEDAKVVQRVRRNYTWLKWGAMAACACILISVTLGSGSFFYSDNATSAPNSNSMNAGSSANGGSAGGGSASSDTMNGAMSEGTQQENSSSYPYSDTKELDYIGMVAANVETSAGTIVFQEITDIETYRAFNNVSKETDTVYYDTQNGAYHHVAAGFIEGKDCDDFVLSVQDGMIKNSMDDASYQELCQNYVDLERMNDYFLKEDKLADSLRGITVADWNVVAIQTGLKEAPNGQITLLMGENLDIIDPQMAAFTTSMKALLGTEQGSTIAGQEVAVQYFYQQRMFRQEALEECYHYYVYFEKDGMQYLYQFSSNWTLPGEEVTALHNPPDTLAYAMSQEEARSCFAEILVGMLGALE